MFGLEGQKTKKSSSEFLFDLEKRIGDPEQLASLSEQVRSRVQKIKESLREGEDHSHFERLISLLQGYEALVKVLSRSTKGKRRSS